jgi:hypothetical protein
MEVMVHEMRVLIFSNKILCKTSLIPKTKIQRGMITNSLHVKHPSIVVRF